MCKLNKLTFVAITEGKTVKSIKCLKREWGSGPPFHSRKYWRSVKVFWNVNIQSPSGCWSNEYYRLLLPSEINEEGGKARALSNSTNSKQSKTSIQKNV